MDSIKPFAFHKLHSLGNDFVIVLAKKDQAVFSSEQLRVIGDRHRGVGFDQLMWVSPTDSADVDYAVRIFNSDGSESGQCINGLRSVGYLLQRVVNSQQAEWCLSVTGVNYRVMHAGGDEYGLQIDQPHLLPEQIPFKMEAQQTLYDLQLEGNETATIGAVGVGNPHAVWRIDNAHNAQSARIAQLIAEYAGFYEGVNVGVCQVMSPNHLRLHVLERGAGWTQACGSGAVAAATVAKINGWIDSDSITIEQPGGQVKVCWPQGDLAVRLSGPVVWVYSGEWCGDE